LAEKAKTPLSTFGVSIIEERLAEDEEFRPRHKITKELEDLRKEYKVLRGDLRRKEIVLERYEAELKRYRAQPFQEADYRGIRHYSKELVDILKAKGVMDSYKILEAMGIDPRESDLVKAISLQLEELEGYGFIKTEGRSWQWIG
jgi:hypothetical protein